MFLEAVKDTLNLQISVLILVILPKPQYKQPV